MTSTKNTRSADEIHYIDLLLFVRVAYMLQKYSCILKTGNRNEIYNKTLITDYISRYYIKYERIRSDCFLLNNFFFIEDFKQNLSVAPASFTESFTRSWRTDFLVLDYGVHYFYMFQSFSYVKREKNLKLWTFDTFQSLEIQEKRRNPRNLGKTRKNGKTREKWKKREK